MHPIESIESADKAKGAEPVLESVYRFTTTSLPSISRHPISRTLAFPFM